MRPTPDSIDLLILCGGQGRRMGGQDKGLLPFGAHTLVEQVLAQTRGWPIRQTYLSANRHLDRYRAFGYPVLADAQADFLGPLAGIAMGLVASQTANHATTRAEALLVLPCDVPYLPPDLLSRLCAAMKASVEITIAAEKTEGTPRVHPSICLVRSSQWASVQAALAARQLRLQSWQDALAHRYVIFDFVFHNLNTPADFAVLTA